MIENLDILPFENRIRYLGNPRFFGIYSHFRNRISEVPSSVMRFFCSRQISVFITFTTLAQSIINQRHLVLEHLYCKK